MNVKMIFKKNEIMEGAGKVKQEWNYGRCRESKTRLG
jgi:hypothetical protein